MSIRDLIAQCDRTCVGIGQRTADQHGNPIAGDYELHIWVLPEVPMDIDA